MIDKRPPADPGPAAATASGPTIRLRAMQHPLDRALYHPIADRLARALARTRVTPNMVSVAGGVAVVLAGIAYVQPVGPWAVFAGLLLHMTWHVLDGADGALARLTGRSSPAGEMVDGICDYASHFVLYLTLAVALVDRTGWWIVALALAAGASRIVQANFYETRRRQFLAWVHGVPWLRHAASSGALPFRGLARIYLRIAGTLAPDDARIDRLVADPDRGPALRDALIRAGPSQLAGSSLLGANTRTLALGIAMAAGSPIWYFLYEIVVLNLVLMVAILRARRTLDAIYEEAWDAPSTLR